MGQHEAMPNCVKHCEMIMSSDMLQASAAKCSGECMAQTLAREERTPSWSPPFGLTKK